MTTENATDFPITEASVANCIAQKNATPSVTDAHITVANVTLDATNNFVTSVPAEDGSTRTLSALKWTGTVTGTADATYYAVEYTKDGKKTYKIVKVVKSTESSSATPGDTTE